MIREIEIKGKKFFAQLELADDVITGHIIDMPACHSQGDTVKEVIASLIEVTELVLEENGKSA